MIPIIMMAPVFGERLTGIYENFFFKFKGIG
jgi:hypothetical protein